MSMEVELRSCVLAHVVKFHTKRYNHTSLTISWETRPTCLLKLVIFTLWMLWLSISIQPVKMENPISSLNKKIHIPKLNNKELRNFAEFPWALEVRGGSGIVVSLVLEKAISL